MRNLIPIILTFIVLIVCSCERKAFPDFKLRFSDKYMRLLEPYNIGDTLVFKSNEGEIETFKITKMDSTIVNTKGWFINQRPYKYISLSYNQFPTKTTYEDGELISLNIYPDTGEESCRISFKNFRGNIEKGTDSMFSKTIIANGLTIEKYYMVENVALDLVKNPADIKTIYITEAKGIAAYQDQNRNWWTRTN